VRDAFRYLTSLLFVAVVVQVALAGLGAFDSFHKADDSGSVTKKAVEDAWSAHAVLGTAIAIVMLVLLLVALLGRLGAPWLPFAGGLFLLGILQIAFAALGSSVPALGFLHAVNALAIYALSGLLAHRAWTRRDTAPA
jgi:hypothetical protein